MAGLLASYFGGQGGLGMGQKMPPAPGGGGNWWDQGSPSSPAGSGGVVSDPWSMAKKEGGLQQLPVGPGMGGPEPMQRPMGMSGGGLGAPPMGGGGNWWDQGSPSAPGGMGGGQNTMMGQMPQARPMGGFGMGGGGGLGGAMNALQSFQPQPKTMQNAMGSLQGMQQDPMQQQTKSLQQLPQVKSMTGGGLQAPGQQQPSQARQQWRAGMAGMAKPQRQQYRTANPKPPKY